MSLGLAFADGERLYMAVDGINVPTVNRDYNERLESKLVSLQEDPYVAIICTGHLWPWAHVVANYVHQASLLAAQSEVDRWIQDNPKKPDCYCLLCGYDSEGQGQIYIGRSGWGVENIEFELGTTGKVQVVGLGPPAQRYADIAQDAIDSGEDPAVALDSAIHQAIAAFPSLTALPVTVLSWPS